MITKKASLLAAAVGSLLFATGIISSANATVLSVTVWTGSPTGDIQSSQTADLGDKPAAANIDATFQYNTSGGLTLNFSDTSPQNTTTAGGLFKTFFASDSGSIVAGSFASPDHAYTPDAAGIAALMATSMSIAGNDYTTYMSFTGTFDFGTGTLVTVRHDDGASFELTDGTLPVEFSSPAETTAISDSFILSGVHPFELDYVAGNGTPSILQVTAVPEASTWAMMIFGFFGVGFMAYRRKGTLPQLRLA